MSDITISITGVDAVRALIAEVEELRKDLRAYQIRGGLKKEWYTRGECARMKGVSRSWLDANQHHYPNFNHSHRIAGGKHAFRWDEVAEWLSLDADEIDRRYQALLSKQMIKDVG